MKTRTILTGQEWSEKLENCDYVFVMNADEMFKEDYAEFFEDAEAINNGTFYKVTKQDGKIILNYIFPHAGLIQKRLRIF